MAVIQPPWQSNFLDNGKVSQAWLQYFIALSNSGGGGGGGGGGGTNTEVAAWFQPQIDTDAIDGKIDGAMATALLAAATGGVGGEDREIQYNDSGSAAGSPNLKFVESGPQTSIVLKDTTITVTDASAGGGVTWTGRNGDETIDGDDITIQAGDSEQGSTGATVVLEHGDIALGGNLLLDAGVGSGGGGFDAVGGDVIITGGEATFDPESPNGTGGDVYIVGGTGGTRNGEVIVKISDQNALSINSSRAFGLGDAQDFGVSGQAIISHGNAAEPEWQDVANSVEITSSETDFTIDPTGPQTGEVQIDLVLNTVPIDKGGTGQTDKTAAFDALSPLTTKGDMIVFDGTDNVPLPAGYAGQVLTVYPDGVRGVAWTDGGTSNLYFDYGDASPRGIFYAVDTTVLEVSIVILTPFNSTATLSVGDAGDLQRLLSTTENLPTEAGTYTTNPGFEYTSGTPVVLSINPGTSTTGSGLVSITYQT